MNSLIVEFKNKWRELTVLVLLCLLELYWFSSLVPLTPMYVVVIVSFIFIIPALLLLISVLKDKQLDKKDKQLLCVFIIVAIICGIARTYLFIISLMIAYLFYDDKQKMYKWLFLINISCLSLFFILCLISIIPNTPFLRYREGMLVNIRHTFGFSHPNHPLKFYFSSIIWGYLWLCKDRKSTIIFSLAMLLFALLIGYDTNCRTGIFTILGLLFLMNLPVLVKPIKTRWLYVLFFMVTIVITFLRPVGFVNSALSGRPEWFQFFFANYPLYILFGKCYVGIFNHPLDNGFMFTIFDGGLIAIVLVALCYYKAFKNNEDVKTKVALIAIFVYSLFEAMSTIYTNPLFILMFSELLVIYFKNKKNINLPIKKIGMIENKKSS